MTSEGLRSGPPEARIEIAKRFCGPPTSGNGGYVAGRLAAHLGQPAARVRLRRPPPLERPLVVREVENALLLLDGDEPVAEARALDLAASPLPEPPTPPDFETAREAARRFRGFCEHVFPGCFVCGTERAEGDGLRIFPGHCAPREGGGAECFAAPWQPDATLAPGGAGRVPPEFVWAALDCPGAFAFPQPEGKVILLGEMRARLEGSVEVGEPCVLVSWPIGHDGRRHTTGSALYGRDGGCRGVAVGVWFEVAPESVPGG